MPEYNLKTLIFIALIIIFIIGVTIYDYFLPKNKGDRGIKGGEGEKTISKLLRKLNKKEYKVFNDIYLEIENKTTQIDHLVISIYGIFVIETKNYQGWIHGSESSEFWTQSIYTNKIKFRNPVKQNWSHIYLLKDILKNFYFSKYHPIIVFAGTATLKNVYSKVPVIYTNELLDKIKEYKEFILTLEDVEYISKQICAFQIKKKRKKKIHEKFVKQNIENRQTLVELMICPNCKGALKIKNGRFGKFHGCSNFPNCKYSRKI